MVAMNDALGAQEPYRTADPIYKLISQEMIQARVSELGQQIVNDYHPRKKSLVVIGILNGALMFISDLTRAIFLAKLPRPTDMPLTPNVELVKLAAYGDRVISSGSARIELDITQTIEGKDVLVVEDIVDTGHTMRFFMETLRARHPNSIRICSLLLKPECMIVPIHIDYVGFSPINREHFVVGYGMDYKGLYRNLPYIGVLGNGKWDSETRVSDTAE